MTHEDKMDKQWTGPKEPTVKPTPKPKNYVVVTDVDIRLASMVALALKAYFAAIVAIIFWSAIIGGIAFALSGLVGALLAALAVAGAS